MLIGDPLYELRSLALAGGYAAGDEVAPGAIAPSAALGAAIAELRIEDGVMGALSAAGLKAFWNEAYLLVASSPELQDALNTMTADGGELRSAVARAITAELIVEALAQESPVPDAAMRDGLVFTIVDALGGGTRSIRSVATDALHALGSRIATRYSVRHRGAISQNASPVAGDILLYQTRGEPIRSFIADVIRAVPSPVTILAHSLGGIAAVDLLAAEKIPSVTQLVTLGSQSPLFYELDLLVSLRWGQPLPPHFPPWLNFYDLRDLLSYIGAGVFGTGVTDVEVKSGQPFPASHGAYWLNPAVWARIAKVLA